MIDIPWDEIDEGIRPIVKVLVDGGIDTFASCSGHGKEWGWVNCRLSDHYEEADIINALTTNDYCGFSVKLVRYVNSFKIPIKNGEKYRFWSIEFWGDECLKPKFHSCV